MNDLFPTQYGDGARGFEALGYGAPLTASDLMRELRVTQNGDWWGTTIAWWFAVAGELNDRGECVPDTWQYRPSPFGGVDADAYEAPYCAAATNEALQLFGRALNRYAAKLKAAGQDY